MNKLYCYYEPHFDNGYVVEYYLLTTDSKAPAQWLGTLSHDGDYDSLYVKCELLAKANNARLEAMIKDLPPLNGLY